MPEDERPENVVVVILTDGAENDSREYTYDKVKALIKQQEDEWNWAFSFLSSDIKARRTGSAMGFAPCAVAQAAGGARGMSVAYAASADVVKGARRGLRGRKISTQSAYDRADKQVPKDPKPDEAK